MNFSAGGFARAVNTPPAPAERTGWYCILQRGARKAWLAGPFINRATAERYMDEAHDAAIRVDPFHHFDTPVIASVTTPRRMPRGLLNGRISIRGGDLLD